MPAINIARAVTAVGVGVVDDVLERMDDGAGRRGFQRWSAWGRVLLVAGGHVATLMGRGQITNTGETVATAATPLLYKELAAMVIAPAAQGAAFTPRRTASDVRARDWTPTAPGRGQYRPL
mgnify:FL=1